MRKIKKYSTGISGLDTLFHGGLQLDSLNADTYVKNSNGLLIVLKGAKGCNKTLLAMQLMHGLLCNLNKRTNARKHSIFASLNKSESDLSDMYLDVTISKLLNTLCTIISKEPSKKEQINQILELIFEPCFTLNKEVNKSSVYQNLIEKIANRVVYYNTRTNGLHYRRVQNYKTGDYILGYYGDDADNMMYVRRDKMDIEEINKSLEGIKSSLTVSSLNRILNILYKSGCETKALIYIQEVIDQLCETKQKNECYVIDGFSKLSTKELMELPYDEMEKLLRKRNKVSILVFDERVEARINADIVIELRRKEAIEEEYVYHELQITKSVFQSAALGWHQYKKRDTGIDVFPSIHMLLSKRNYLPYKLLTMHNSILQETYEEYLSYADCYRIANKCNQQNIDEVSEYYEKKELREYELLRNIASTSAASENVKDLCDVILGNVNGSNNHVLHGWHDHLPSTAIIGNPNCYKRQFAIAGAFHAAKLGEHTIFVLFDKNEADMRRRMRCPSLNIQNNKWECAKNETTCSRCEVFKNGDCEIKECYECYKYIHFFQIRMGCISAEEFFDALLKQIQYFNNLSKGKPCHIVIDDLQKIDYSFPFLRKTPLFLSTLITLCRQNFVELKMICDKRANLVGELCSLSDNVLCISREEDDIDNITVYMERNFGGIQSSGLAKYIISTTDELFTCSNRGISINANNIQTQKVASMKEYWRKTQNIILKKRNIK